jgi:hypothetical protein
MDALKMPIPSSWFELRQSVGGVCADEIALITLPLDFDLNAFPVVPEMTFDGREFTDRVVRGSGIERMPFESLATALVPVASGR